jgi:hypothetical protein
MVGAMAQGLPDNHHPAELATVIAPRWIELCFQTAGLWEMGTQGRMGLPAAIERVTFMRAPAPGRLYAVVHPQPAAGTFAAEVLDANGNVYLQLTGYRTATFAGAIDSERLKVVHAAMSPELVAA